MDPELVIWTAPKGLHHPNLQQLDRVTSGIPQGSVLGPLLFLIYINDLDSGVVSKITKLANDTKLCHSSIHPYEVIELQEDLNRLVVWANYWQMNFNVVKCTVIHIGHKNIKHNYTMPKKQLIATEEQRDLGITIIKDLKWQKQTEQSCNIHCPTFNYKSTELMLPLYKSLVLPHVEYAAKL